MTSGRWILDKGKMLVAQKNAMSAEIDEWREATQAILANPQLDTDERDQLPELRRQLAEP